MGGLLIGIGIAVALWAVAVIVLLSSLAVVWIASPIDLITESSSPGRWRMRSWQASVLRQLLRRTDRSVMFEHWVAIPATLEVIVRGWPTRLFRRLTVWSRVFEGPRSGPCNFVGVTLCHF